MAQMVKNLPGMWEERSQARKPSESDIWVKAVLNVRGPGDLAIGVIASIWVGLFTSVSRFSSVAQSCPTLRPHESQHSRPPCPSPTPGVYSNSCPSSR